MLHIPPHDRLIVALDFASVGEAERLVERVGEQVSFYKVGLQLIFAGGLPFAAALAGAGKKVFLDVKLLDIDNTVEGAIKSIAAMGVTFATVHAYPKAMRAAVAARGAAALQLLAVTVLTSMDDADLAAAGYRDGASALVARRARDARDAGVDGIVASPAEATAVRDIVGPSVAIVTPGIRPVGSEAGDQKRIATPAQAIRDGADYLVIGRQVTRAKDPASEVDRILLELA